MLKPQTTIKLSNSYWNNLHNHIQDLLNVHSEQGNKINIFPFDLSYKILNKWFSNEQESYIPELCYDCSFDEYRNKNVLKLQNARKNIHNRIQSLLDIHIDKSKPFPIDLSYMLNLSVSDLIDSYNYDKNYNYERRMADNFYSGPTAYFEFLFKDKYDVNYTHSFCDFEKFDEISKFNVIKKFGANDFLPAPTKYLLWKSAHNDYLYDYNRTLDPYIYNPDNYLPNDNNQDEVIEYSEYYDANDELEPDFNKFVYIS